MPVGIVVPVTRPATLLRQQLRATPSDLADKLDGTLLAVLSRDEVMHFLKTVSDLSTRTTFITSYASGLRVPEVVASEPRRGRPMHKLTGMSLGDAHRTRCQALK